MAAKKMVDFDDVLKTIDICKSVVIARQEAESNKITSDKAQSYILERIREIERLAHVITGIDIVRKSIEKIYKEEQI